MADPALPVKITRTLYRGDARTITHVFTDTDSGDPIDLSGYDFLSQYRDDLNRGTLVCEAVCTVGGADNNQVVEVLDQTQADLLPGQTDPKVKPKLYWDLQSTDPDGNPHTWYWAIVPVMGDTSNV